jgi:hypothetical protein
MVGLVFLVSGTNFTEMLAANDWKQFQSCLRYTVFTLYRVIAISVCCNIGLLQYRVIAI